METLYKSAVNNVNYDNVQDFQICRICLAKQVTLHNLRKLGLVETFSEFSHTTVTPADKLPHYICYYCLALLYKCLKFKAKCQEAYIFFQKFCKENDVITPENLHNLENAQFSTTLVFSEIKINEYLPHKELQSTQINEISNAINVKIEPFEEIDDYEMPISNDESDFKITAQQLDVKTEKEMKVKKETKKRKSKKELSDERVMKKHKYNEKFEEDFVAFADIYNVDVIFLSKEEQIEQIKCRKEELRSKKNSYRYHCEKCYKGFQTETAYKRHNLIHESSRGSHICDVCQNRFPTRKLLQRHSRLHKIQFICRICRHVNKNSSSAKLHHKWHQGLKFECQFCFKKFNAQSTKLNHVRENHTSVQCEVCRLTLNGSVALGIHKMKSHGDVQTFQCSKCGVQFHTKLAYERHDAGTGCDVTAECCSVCGDSFENKDLLNKHSDEKHKDCTFKCTACPASFATDRGLGIHWTRSHARAESHCVGPTAAETYMCEICAKSYSTAVKLKYHQRIHSGEKPYKCTVCPKMFRLQTQLKIHVNTHTGEKPFKCGLCPETFKSYAQKHKHKLLVHIKERPYKCNMCEKSYVVSFDLKMHTRFAHMHIPRPPRRNRNKNILK